MKNKIVSHYFGARYVFSLPMGNVSQKIFNERLGHVVYIIIKVLCLANSMP